MKKVWIEGLDEDEVNSIKGDFVQGHHLRERLVTILEGRLDNLGRVETDKKLFDSPGWAYRQASIIGEKMAYREVINLLNEK